MDNVKMTGRNWGGEVLRILAIFLIVLAHSIPVYGDPAWKSNIDLNYAQDSFRIAFLTIFLYLGHLGDCIFFFISAYFLIDKEEIKKTKITGIISDTLFFSIVWLLIFVLSGKELDCVSVIWQIFPITTGRNWFVGCYLLLYICHPLLNIIIDNISKAKHLSICITMFFLYSIVSTGTLGYKYDYSRLIGAIEIYFIATYTKKYMKLFFQNTRNNLRILGISGGGVILCIIMQNIIGNNIDYYSSIPSEWMNFINPFLILATISLFYLFLKIKPSNVGIIKNISSLSLLYYVIYENYLFRKYWKPLIWRWIYDRFSYEHVYVLIIAVGFVAFICTGIIGYLYKLVLKKYINGLFQNLIEIICVWGRYIRDKIMQIE